MQKKTEISFLKLLLLLALVFGGRSADAATKFGFNYWPAGYSCDVLYGANWTIENKDIVKADLDVMVSCSTEVLRLMVWPQKSGYLLTLGGGGGYFTQDFNDVTNNFLELLEMCRKRGISVILSFGNNYKGSQNPANGKYWWEEAYGSSVGGFTNFLGDTRTWINGFVDKIEASPWASTVIYYDYHNEWYSLRLYADWYIQYLYDWTNIPSGKRYVSLLMVRSGHNDAADLKTALGSRVVDCLDFHSYPLVTSNNNIEYGFDLVAASYPSTPIYLGEYGAAGMAAGDESIQQTTVLDISNRAVAKGFAGMLHWMLWDNAPPAANQIIGWGYTPDEPKDVMGGMADLLTPVPNADMELLNGIEPADWSAGGTVPLTFYYNNVAATNLLCARILVNNTSGKVWMSSSLIPVTGGRKLFLNSYIRSSMDNVQMNVREYDINQTTLATFYGPKFTPPLWQWYNFTHQGKSWFVPLSDRTRYITVSIGGDVRNNPSILDVDTVSVWESNAQALRSDFNNDGAVNSLDLAGFIKVWLTSQGSIDWDNRYDLALPQDGAIDFKDFAYLAKQWMGGSS